MCVTTSTHPGDDRQVARPRAVVHLTVTERTERGRAARRAAPRARHAEFAADIDRPDPIALLEAQAESRVPELVPIRYGRMLASPFAFYRGAAAIMSSDLAATPVSGIRVQLCGDAHLSNFGVFGTPERRLIFDINDFDETAPGPWEWDLKRLATSLEVAGRENRYSDAERTAIVLASARSYRVAMADFAEQTNLDVFYASLDIEAEFARLESQVTKAMKKRADATLAKARTRDSMHALTRLTREVDGQARILSQPPLVVPVSELYPDEIADDINAWAHRYLREYRRTLDTDRRRLLEGYRFIELARKVVGVGSVGTRAWIALMLGRAEDDPLFLQLKEAQTSVLEPYCGRSEYRNAGHRVVAGQRLMQAASDAFLGWVHVTGVDGIERDFYVRQLRDWKGSAEVGTMTPKGMEIYAGWCGWTLARAHARSGDRVAIAGYLGKSDAFDRAIAAFSVAYADQNAHDYQALHDAAATGRIIAETGL
jgi:uncharacterized protein (DUF2252 family)